MRARASALPPKLWLAGIVGLSFIVWAAVGHRTVAPWIMTDELTYTELARSFAEHGHFAVRGVSANSFGFVYPLLIAPAWRLFSGSSDAYAASKVTNSFVMSLAAVPAYFLARKLLRPGPALGVAALTVMVPSMLYTGMLMTENVFYPLFLVVALALYTMLERPTRRNQVVLVALCALAYLTRAQAVALLAAVATAPVVLLLVDRRPWRAGLRPFATLYGIFAAGAALALVATVARGRSLTTLLGAYKAATSGNYTFGGVAHDLLYHAGELDLSLGVIPFAALLAMWFAPRRLTGPARVFVATSLPVVFWLVLEVAAFASTESAGRIEERNMFYVAPLALIALVGLAADGIVPARRRPLLLAAAAAAALPFFLPYATVINTGATADTFGLLPWWSVRDHLVGITELRWAALAASAACAATFLLLPRRFALILPVLVAGFFVASAFVVESGRHGIRNATLAASYAGTGVASETPADWIERAVGRSATVNYLWSGNSTRYTVWENEFFNRNPGAVYTFIPGYPDPMPTTLVTRSPSGGLVAGGKPVDVAYMVADGSDELQGHPVAADPSLDLTLYRVNGPAIVLNKITGLYPDGWSGETVTYTRLECSGGRLIVDLNSDPGLYSTDQVVVASEGGAEVGRARIAPSGQAALRVPLRPVAGRCSVRFDMAQTLVPTKVHPGVGDDNRALGAHFSRFEYTP